MNGNPLDFGAQPRAGFARILFIAVALACLTTSPHAARAQDLDDVTFSGVVTDQRGAVVPGARVTARRAGTKAERTATTDGAGRYRLVELAPGVYTLSVACAGFAAEFCMCMRQQPVFTRLTGMHIQKSWM